MNHINKTHSRQVKTNRKACIPGRLFFKGSLHRTGYVNKSSTWGFTAPDLSKIESDYALLDLLAPLIGLDRSNPLVYICHKTLAQWTGWSLSAIKRALKRLIKRGLIYTIYRHMQSSLFRVNSYVYSDHAVNILKEFIPALRRLSTKLLISLSNKGKSHCDLHTKINTGRNPYGDLSPMHTSIVISPQEENMWDDFARESYSYLFSS